jgi:hypothetical protein
MCNIRVFAKVKICCTLYGHLFNKQYLNPLRKVKYTQDGAPDSSERSKIKLVCLQGSKERKVASLYTLRLSTPILQETEVRAVLQQEQILQG